MNYTKKAVHGTTMVLIMGVVAALIAYATRIVMARKLTPEEYGLFYAVFTLISFFLFFRDLGIGLALVKFIPEFKIQEKLDYVKSAILSVIGFQLLSSLIFSLAVFLLSDFLAVHYFKDPSAKIILQLLLFYVLGSVFYRVFRSTFNGFQNTKIYSILEPLKNGTALLLILLFFHLGFQVLAPVLAYALVCFVVVLILLPSFLKTFPLHQYKAAEFRQVTKNLFLFGIPMFATSIAGKLITDIDTLMLTHFRPLQEVGIYNTILPSAMLFLYFSSSISAVIFPIVVELWIQKDQRRITEGVRLLSRYLFFIIIPPALAIFMFSKPLILIFFGEGYAAGALALQILIIGMLFYVVAGVNLGIITAIGKPKLVTKIIIIAAILNIILNFILIPPFGIEGAALTTALSYLVILILSTRKIIYFFQVRFPYDLWIKLIFAGLAFAAVVYGTQHFLSFSAAAETIIALLLALLMYIFIAFYLKIIDWEEIKRYGKPIMKR